MTKQELKEKFSVECTETDTTGRIVVKGTPMDIINWIVDNFCLAGITNNEVALFCSVKTGYCPYETKDRRCTLDMTCLNQIPKDEFITLEITKLKDEMKIISASIPWGVKSGKVDVMELISRQILIH